MAKLTILVFLALFAFAHVATAFRATITTSLMEDEAENPRRKEESCVDQFRMQQQLRHCQMHLREKCRSPSMLLMSMDREEEQYREQCCQQLRNMDERCRCKGLQQVVRRVQEQQEQQEQQEDTHRERRQRVEEIIIREAENLPSKCNLRPSTCTISRPRW